MPESMTFFRPFDIIILLIFIAGAAVSTMVMSAGAGSKAVIYESGAKIAEINISGEITEKVIPTKAGKFKIQYGKNAIRILASPCMHKVCVKQKDIHHTNEQIICIPSRVVITIEDTQADSGAENIDAITR